MEFPNNKFTKEYFYTVLPDFLNHVKSIRAAHLGRTPLTIHYLNNELHFRVHQIALKWHEMATLANLPILNEMRVWQQLTNQYVKLLSLYCIQMVQGSAPLRQKMDIRSLKAVQGLVKAMFEIPEIELLAVRARLPYGFQQGLDYTLKIIQADLFSPVNNSAITNMLHVFCCALDKKVIRDQFHLQQISEKNRTLALTAHSISPPIIERRPAISIQSSYGENDVCSASFATAQGLRPYQEDRWDVQVLSEGEISYFAVFDGHGGAEASSFSQTRMVDLLTQALDRVPEKTPVILANMLIEACLVINEEILSQWPNAGTTATIAFIMGNHLVVGTVGDSEAILGWRGESGFFAERLTPAANLDSDYFRNQVHQRGGRIIETDTLRINGNGPNMASSLGCAGMQVSMSSEPMLSYTDLSKFEDIRLILASDGVWGDLTPQKAVEMAYTKGHTASKIVAEAYHHGSTDNITAIVVEYKRREEERYNSADSSPPSGSSSENSLGSPEMEFSKLV